MRARKYNRSANWIEDAALVSKMMELAQTASDSYVLDLATGTGKLAEAFRGEVGSIVGLDLSPDMTRLAKGAWDELVMGSAEDLPFENERFDVCVCRMGLQFMRLDLALPEIYRILKSRGTVVFCHLTAYGPEDKETAFLIQKLRNPARRNFFLPEDVPNHLVGYGFIDVESYDYISVESVEQWINNGAIHEDVMDKIRNTYRAAPQEFKGGDILDSFRMGIVKGRKPA